MKMSATTTTRGFRTEDITFRGARKQSAVEDEIRAENPELFVEDIVEVPISLTPEQVINFYKQKIERAVDSNEKRLYSQTIKWINELADVKKQLLILEAKTSKKAEDNDYDNGIEEN